MSIKSSSKQLQKYSHAIIPFQIGLNASTATVMPNGHIISMCLVTYIPANSLGNKISPAVLLDAFCAGPLAHNSFFYTNHMARSIHVTDIWLFHLCDIFFYNITFGQDASTVFQFSSIILMRLP